MSDVKIFDNAAFAGGIALFLTAIVNASAAPGVGAVVALAAIGIQLHKASK